MVFRGVHCVVRLQTGALAGHQSSKAVLVLVAVVCREDLALAVIAIVEPVVAHHQRMGEARMFIVVWLLEAVVLHNIEAFIAFAVVVFEVLLVDEGTSSVRRSGGKIRSRTGRGIVIVAISLIRVEAWSVAN